MTDEYNLQCSWAPGTGAAHLAAIATCVPWGKSHITNTKVSNTNTNKIPYFIIHVTISYQFWQETCRSISNEEISMILDKTSTNCEQEDFCLSNHKQFQKLYAPKGHISRWWLAQISTWRSGVACNFLVSLESGSSFSGRFTRTVNVTKPGNEDREFASKSPPAPDTQWTKKESLSDYRDNILVP